MALLKRIRLKAKLAQPISSQECLAVLKVLVEQVSEVFEMKNSKTGRIFSIKRDFVVKDVICRIN